MSCPAVRRLLLAVLVSATIAGCGGRATGNKTLTVESVLSSTRRQPTLRFSTTVVSPPDTSVVMSYKGAVDAAGHASFVLSQPGAKGEEDEIWAGGRIFSRVDAGGPGLSHDWCRVQHVSKTPGAGVSPVD